MKKNLIIAIFSVVIAFMAGYIIAGKYNMMLSNDDENDSTQLYDNGREQREESTFRGNSAIDFTDARTFQFEAETFRWNGKGGLTGIVEPRSITLFPDYTAILSMDEDKSLNWQIMEGSVNGEIIRCIYIYINEDTAHPAYIISEDGRIKTFTYFDSLNSFLSTTVGSVEGEITVGLFCKAVKVSLKNEPKEWTKCKYKDGTVI
ncbi:hypothetical protein [Hoylesella loescheii]|jgi:hypothetical protein|uniref:hypothetical protein n=1 Tax=Hoylesella loescheii TaxID=840 RepID=UPI00248E676F|nr:hypothetical protein [Hoylesella loescheii]